MKICILGENKSVHIQKWIKAIALNTDIQLHVICFKGGVEFPNVNYHYLREITRNKIDYFLNAFLVKKLIYQIKPQILHAHYATSYGFLGAFSYYKPYIITGWGADIFDSPKNIFLKKLIKWSLSKSDEITVLSKMTQIEMLKLSNKNVRLIPFGVDVDKFKPNKNKKNETLKIGTIRTLSEKYGVEFLIRAFALVCEKNPDIELHIVGDGPLREQLKNLTIDLQIDKKVVFYGYVNQNEEFEKYIRILTSFDIFAILSIYDSETFGVAAVEASACGIPVIGTKIGGLPEVIDDGSTGILVNPSDTNDTAEALFKLISNKELRKILGDNGRCKVVENYNWDSNVNQMISLYKSLIKY